MSCSNPRLIQPPKWRRLIVGAWRFLASLRLGSVLLGVWAVMLGWATYVEIYLYGPKPTQFAIYGSRWFAAMFVLLAVNVFCAAAIRFPWNRRQAGFVITHVGLLALLAGCLLTRLDGIDSQIYLPEGRQSHRAYKNSQQFTMRILPYAAAERSPADGSPDPRRREAAEAARGEKIAVPFAAGPFNWCDYAQLWWFPWRLAHRDCGVLYDTDGIRLEALDYNSDSELPADESAGSVVRPVPWKKQLEKERRQQPRQRRAKVRLTVDGSAEEFWIDGSNPSVAGFRPEANAVRTVAGQRRRVELALEFDAFDLGFDVYLHRFDRRLDPGTSMASHYGSEVDFRQRPDKSGDGTSGDGTSGDGTSGDDTSGDDTSGDDTSGDDARPGKPRAAAILTNVYVTLNEPIDFMDPATGRSYRFFQESYQEYPAGRGPGGDDSGRTREFVSILTVNYDPGRGAKYLGSLLIVVGVFIMFRMRAYVFQRRPSAESPSK